MQLPGMATDPVRVSTDATWWPTDDTYGASLRIWLQDARTGQWVLQEMRTTGTPITYNECRDQVRQASERTLAYLEDLRELHLFPPFP